MSGLIAYGNQINNVFQLIGNSEDGYYKFKKVKQIKAENGLCLTLINRRYHFLIKRYFILKIVKKSALPFL